MEPSDRQQSSRRLSAGGPDEEGRSPALAFGTFDVDLMRKNERTVRDDEFTDEEAEAFGYC